MSSYVDGFASSTKSVDMLPGTAMCVCGHPRGDHAYKPGREDAGKCLVSGCDCQGMKEEVTSKTFMCIECSEECTLTSLNERTLPHACPWLMIVPKWKVLK